MTALDWALALGVVAIGACAQGSIGFGLGLLAAPGLALIDGRLVPGPLLIVALVLTLMVAGRERGRLDLSGVKWALVGRVPGTVVGALAVATLPERTLLVLFALMVLAAVGLSVAGWRVEPRPFTLLSAGAASGLMGSMTSIGGPPMAIVYQHRSGAELRAALAVFFVFGSLLSIVMLALVGEVGSDDTRFALALLPAALAGYAASASAARWLDNGLIRPAVLGVSAVSAVVLLAAELIG